MERDNDRAVLVGEAAGRPELSHRGREGEYWRFPLAVERLSGAVDTLNIIARKELLEALDVEDGRLRITGEVRSYNNRSGQGAKLVLTVLAREMSFTGGDFENSVYLSGALCKEPCYRRTPMGREICDLMLAVNRPRGGSDYLPVIVWGADARDAASLHTGSLVELTGRMQSRAYVKYIEDEPTEKVAYEISAREFRIQD